MSWIGLRVGPFEIVEAARLPEPGTWVFARRVGGRGPAEVLLRVLPPDAGEQALALLQQEYEQLKGIDDPRVPPVLGWYEGAGAMALTAVRGVPLQKAIEGRRTAQVPMSPPTLLDLALEVAETLVHLSLQGRVHGHLDPEKIWLAPDGRVWIFGYSGGPTAAPHPRWTAPERARGLPATEATDQWALGALLAGLVTGQFPWKGSDPDAAARNGHLGHLVDPVETQWPALGRLLRRLLDPHPSNRFPSLPAVRQELLTLARKAQGASGRRDLAALLWRLHGVESAPPPEVDAPPYFDAEPPSQAESPSEVEISEALDTEQVAPVVTPPPATPPPTAPAPAIEATPAPAEPTPALEVVFPSDPGSEAGSEVSTLVPVARAFEPPPVPAAAPPPAIVPPAPVPTAALPASPLPPPARGSLRVAPAISAPALPHELPLTESSVAEDDQQVFQAPLPGPTRPGKDPLDPPTLPEIPADQPAPTALVEVEVTDPEVSNDGPGLAPLPRPALGAGPAPAEVSWELRAEPATDSSWFLPEESGPRPAPAAPGPQDDPGAVPPASHEPARLAPVAPDPWPRRAALGALVFLAVVLAAVMVRWVTG